MHALGYGVGVNHFVTEIFGLSAETYVVQHQRRRGILTHFFPIISSS